MATDIDSLQIQITATSAKANSAIDRLVENLDKLTASLSRVNGSNLNSVSKGAQQVSKAGKDMDNFLKKTSGSATRTKKSFKGLAFAIGTFYANFGLAIRGVKDLYSSLEGTADYLEAYNYFEVALNEIGKDWAHQFEQYGYSSAEAYADSFKTRLEGKLSGLSGIKLQINANDRTGLLEDSNIKNLGLNIQEVTKYASQLASVTNSVGQTGEVSLAAASAFTKLGADMSSLFNVDYSSVMTNLQSGLIGQSRALYKYGIDITNATLQTYAYGLGVEKAVSEMTQAEKMQLRMIAILDQSRISWGDQANTINSLSNSIRQFKNNIKEAGMILSQLFVPILTKIMPIINGVTIAIKRLMVSVAGLFGVKLNLSDFGQSTGGVSDEIGGVADSMDDATEAAKNLKKATTTLGIDELNINSPQTDTGSGTSGGVGGGLDLTQDILNAAEEYEKAWQEAYDRMQNKAEEFANRITKALEPVLKIFKDFAVGDFFQAGQDVSNLVVSITDFFARAIDKVDWYGIGQKIGDFFAGIDWISIFRSVGNLMWQGLKAAFELVSGLFSSAPLEATIISLVTMNKWLKAITASEFTTGFQKLKKAIKPVIDTFVAFKKGTGSSLTAGLGAIETGVISLRNSMTGLQKAAITAIAGFVEFNIVSNSFQSIIEGSENLIAEITKIGATVAAAGAAMTLVLGFPTGVIATGIIGLIGAIKGINDGIESLQLNSVFETIQTTGTVSLEALGNVAKSAFENITAGVDTTIEKLNSISQTRESIGGTVESITSIKDAIDNGAYSVSEKVPEIIEQFTTLLSESKNVLEEEYNVIVSNVVGAWADVLTAQGQSIPEVVAGLLDMTNEGKAAYAELETSLNSLITQYENGEISAEEFYAQSEPLFEQLVAINSDGSIDNAAASIQDLGGALDMSQYISDGSFDTSSFQSYIDNLAEIGAEGKNNLERLGAENKATLDSYKQHMEGLGTDAANYDWATLYGASESQVSQGISDIDSAYAQFANQVQYDLLEQLPGIVESATADYENLHWWEKLFTTKEGYVQSQIDQWQENVLAPATSSLQSGFEELGIEGETWADTAATKLSGSLFDNFVTYTNNAIPVVTSSLKEDWQTILNDSFGELGEIIDIESYGKSTVDGYNNGITNNMESTYDAILNWQNSIPDTVHDSKMKYGSPSKKMEEFGKYTLEGYNLGITKNQDDTILVITNFVDAAVSAFEKIISPMYQIGQDAMQGLYDGLASMEGALYSKAQSIANNISSTIRGALEIHSPSRVMFELGGYTIEGFKEGMESLYQPTIESLKGFSYNVQVAPMVTSFPDSSYVYSHSADLPSRNYGNEVSVDIKQAIREVISEMLTPYLSDIAESNREVADKDFSVEIGDRDIYRASLRGAKAVGRLIVT